MKQVQKVLIFIVDRELRTVQLVEVAALGLQQEAHHQCEHQNVELVVLIDWPGAPLILIQDFLCDLFCGDRRCLLWRFAKAVRRLFLGVSLGIQSVLQVLSFLFVASVHMLLSWLHA